MTLTAQCSSTEKVDRNRLDAVRARLRFMRNPRRPDERPETVTPGSDDHAQEMVRYEVPIHNARPIASELSLDREGFILVRHKTAFANERDTAVLRDKYHAEMVSFIKEYFGASWVVPFRAGLCVRSAAQNEIDTVEKTSVAVHVDYAPIGGAVVAATEDQEQGLPIRPYSRLMIIQAWRALSPPPQDRPLALCDGSTVDEDDIIYDYYMQRREQFVNKIRTCYLYHNPNQRWYFFPELTADELILFKGYDSEAFFNRKASSSGLVSNTPHTSFDSRSAYPQAKPRTSIEARFFVYFE